MRKIDKGSEPLSLTRWKAANPTGKYTDLEYSLREDVRSACLQEQFGLCAYCCQSITGEGDCCNEHVEARSAAPNRELDFSNIVASCNSRGQCDDAHGAQSFSLTPFMVECETELKFKISGRVEGTTERAKETIRVLNLGDHEKSNRKLVEKRKVLSQALLLRNGIDPSDGLEDDELLQAVIDDIAKPVNGKLSSYAPVVVNILQGWMS